jgi:hypothetical protein
MTGGKNQVLVKGNSDLSKVPYKNMKFVTVYAGVNGCQKSIGVELAINSIQDSGETTTALLFPALLRHMILATS